MPFNVIFLLKSGKIEKIIKIGPLQKLSLKIWGSFSFLHIPSLLFEQYSCQTCHTLFLEDMIVKHYSYLSKLEAKMVTSTSSEIVKTLILQAWSIFFKGAHLKDLWSKKVFFMKTMSKLGALIVFMYSCMNVCILNVFITVFMCVSSLNLCCIVTVADNPNFCRIFVLRESLSVAGD